MQIEARLQNFNNLSTTTLSLFSRADQGFQKSCARTTDKREHFELWSLKLWS